MESQTSGDSFHWELEFPEVFERGGFSAFIGNPPWETLVDRSKEFFSNYDPIFASYGKQNSVRRARELRQVDRLSGATVDIVAGQLQAWPFCHGNLVYTRGSLQGN